MDLRQLYKETLQALDKREQEIEQEKQRILDKESDLNTRETQLAEAFKQLEADIHTVSDVRDAKALREENAQKQIELHNRELAVKQEEINLKKKENDLYQIKVSQDEREQQLLAREQELTVREREYKERLKDEFMKEMKFKLGA